MNRDRQLRRVSDLRSGTGVRFGTSGIRGPVSELSFEICYAYTAAFWKVAGKGTVVVLGHDLRPSSPDIAARCASAFSDLGVNVLYVGELPTPAVALFALHLGAPAIMVTGSHIPFDRNGIKFYSAEGEITKDDEERIERSLVVLGDELCCARLPNKEPAAEAFYVERYERFFGNEALAGMRIGLYEHSGVARDVLKRILVALGAEVVSFGRTQSFVAIDTEALREEDVREAKEWAACFGINAIVSTDGDADRPLIADEKGEWLRGDTVGVLCAEFLNADVVVTPVSSNSAVEKCGRFGKVARTRIGSPYVLQEMKTVARPASVVVGYEANGGVLLGSEVVRGVRRLSALPTRDAVLPILALLVMARERGCRVSELVSHLPRRFTFSDRIREFATEDGKALVSRFDGCWEEAGAALAPDAGAITSVDCTDGFRATFSTGEIVHLRPSGNAPELRCYAEADSAERAEYLCRSCLARLRCAVR